MPTIVVPSWIRTLPDWLWANPALHRERLLHRGERPGAPTARTRLREAVLWLGLACVLVGYFLGARWLSSPGTSPWEARGALVTFSFLYLVVVSVMLPGPAAAAIAADRDSQAWRELLLTGLRPSQLVSAKLFALLSDAGRAALLLLPVWLPAYHASALPGDHFLPLLGILALAPVGVTTVCLALSAACRRTLTAVVLAYVLVLGLFWGTAFLPAQFHVQGDCPAWYLSPAWQAMLLCLFEPARSPLARPLLPEWAWFLGAAPVVAAGAFGIAVRQSARAEA